MYVLFVVRMLSIVIVRLSECGRYMLMCMFGLMLCECRYYVSWCVCVMSLLYVNEVLLVEIVSVFGCLVVCVLS